MRHHLSGKAVTFLRLQWQFFPSEHGFCKVPFKSDIGQINFVRWHRKMQELFRVD
jgi:hypothetical protein